MTWTTARYNGRVEGNAQTAFSRNVATVGGDGSAVSANQRRYNGEVRGIAGNIAWATTGYTSSQQLMGCGPDFDGTPLLATADSASVEILAVNDSARTVALANSTLFSALPGVGGAITYRIRAVSIHYGLIYAVAERMSSASVVGTTVFISQDRGATWTRGPASTADGGGDDIPTPTVYGANLDGFTRMREWALAAFPEGGMSAAGDFSKTDVWFCWTDYMHAGGAKGYAAYVTRATRASETATSWTVGTTRLIDARYSAAPTGNLHGHSVAMTGSGAFLIFVGDDQMHASFVLVTLDHDAYETATPAVTRDWYGSLVDGGTQGEACPQIISPTPAPGGGVWCSNDVWPSALVHIDDVATASDSCNMTGLYMPSDSTTYAGGWDTLIQRWYPGVGWTNGGYVSVTGYTGMVRHMTYDGATWAACPNSEAIKGSVGAWSHHLAGQCLIGLHPSSGAIMAAPLPKITRARTLLLSSGFDDKRDSASLEDFTQPTAPNTRKHAYWDGSAFRYTVGDALVANAPTSTPPLLNAQYLVLGCESTGSYIHGWKHLQPSGQTINEAGNIGLACYVAPLGPKACGYVGLSIGGGSGGVSADRTTERLQHPDVSPGHWAPYPHWGDPVNNNTTLRAAVFLTAGQTATLPNRGCPMLLAIGGLYESSIVPYPTGPLTTGNPHELEVVTIPAAAGTDWTVAVTCLRPLMSPTLTANATASGTIWTAYKDANNYATVAFNGSDTVTVTPTVGGVAGTAISLVVGKWLRSMPLTVMLADNGTALDASALSVAKGVVSGTSASGSLGAALTAVRLSNPAQTSVYNLEVAGVAHREDYLDATERSAELADMQWLQQELPTALAQRPMRLGAGIGF